MPHPWLLFPATSAWSLLISGIKTKTEVLLFKKSDLDLFTYFSEVTITALLPPYLSVLQAIGCAHHIWAILWVVIVIINLVPMSMHKAATNGKSKPSHNRVNIQKISSIRCNRVNIHKISPRRYNQVNIQKISPIRYNLVNIHKISPIRCNQVNIQKISLSFKSRRNWHKRLSRAQPQAEFRKFLI